MPLCPTFLWINREKFHKAFAADVTNDEAAVMAAVQRPLSIASFTESEGKAAWKSIPSWYLVCTDDQMIPPPAQEFMAKRMKATIETTPSGHARFSLTSQCRQKSRAEAFWAGKESVPTVGISRSRTQSIILDVSEGQIAATLHSGLWPEEQEKLYAAMARICENVAVTGIGKQNSRDQSSP